MNCNKCGTPILPGEHICRFCGSIDNFSERKVVVEEPELIDFDFEENLNEVEIIDFMLGEDEVSLDVETDKEEKSLDIALDEFNEPMPTVEDIPSVDLEEKVEEPIEETIQVEETPEKEEKVEVEKVEDNKDDEEPKDGKGSLITIIILVILLVASIGLNFYFLFGDKIKNNESLETNNTFSKVILDNYMLNVPSNWNAKYEENEVILFDESNKWAASVSYSTELDYSKISASTNDIIAKYGEQKYLLSSDYTKTVNNKEFYIFKGRYCDMYAAYLIFSEVDGGVSLTDLKFVSEVDENVIDTILESLSNVSEGKVTKLFKDSFEFNNHLDTAKLVIGKDEKEE